MKTNHPILAQELIKCEAGGIHPEIRLYLSKSSRFFGIGPCELLRKIEEEGSLKQACAAMNLSYSKGWHIIANLEKQLGVRIAESKRGGFARGQTELTENGKTLLSLYDSFLAECTSAVELIFEKQFSGWIKGL